MILQYSQLFVDLSECSDRRCELTWSEFRLVCEKYEVTNGCTIVIALTIWSNRSVCHLSIRFPWNIIASATSAQWWRKILTLLLWHV